MPAGRDSRAASLPVEVVVPASSGISAVSTPVLPSVLFAEDVPPLPPVAGRTGLLGSAQPVISRLATRKATVLRIVGGGLRNAFMGKAALESWRKVP